MKQKNILCAAGLALFLISGCGKTESQLKYIGVSKAKTLALEAAGVAASQAEFASAKLSEHQGQEYYKVAFSALGEEYVYDIDALTGTVIDADTPSAESQEAGPSAGSQEVSPSAGSQEVSPPAGMQAVNPLENGMLTEQEAKERAMVHAGMTKDQVSFSTCGLDKEDGRCVYEMEFYVSDGSSYDYEIDAYTGEVVSFDYDAKTQAIQDASKDSRMTEQEAMELALAQVPGASRSDIREFETDSEDGRTEYEGKIRYDGMEYEFEIDAYSGAFRSWEAEQMDEACLK